jgi:cytochrome c oxidase cbb3-type subunit 1
MVGFLFRVYGADRGPPRRWCRPVLWVWSAALGVGVFSWLSGHSSGKLFLDWSGYARELFPGALLVLWLLLVFALIGSWGGEEYECAAWAAKLVGLVDSAGGAVCHLYVASSPNSYPPVNPDTGGPTGASQLESSLAIVAILLMLPFGLTRRRRDKSRAIAIAWIVLAAESILCAALGRADISHHQPAQFLSLGSLLVWLPLTPAYYAAFKWHRTLAAGGWLFSGGGLHWSSQDGSSFFPEFLITLNSPMASSVIPSLPWQALHQASSSSSWSSFWAMAAGFSIAPAPFIYGMAASSPISWW